MIPAMKIFPHLLAAAFVSLAFIGSARAHPHVWVTVTSQVVYGPNGAATGVRHAWKFDDMYSAFALEGLPQKTKGVFTREDLAGLAEVNISSLKESDFFTFAKANGKDVTFGDAADYSLDYQNEVLTLNFTLPFKVPVKEKDLSIEVYDPGYFVDLSFAEKDAVALVGAPAQCKIALEKPKETGVAQGQQNLGESYFANMNMGANFSTKIAVKCP
jgi:ABC-type uncharacterized transport system substrate-binding protein